MNGTSFRRLAALLLAACSAPRAKPSPATRLAHSAMVDSAPPWRGPADRIDSILPTAEYLRRFRAGIEEPAGFSRGAPNGVALARRVLAALGERDTAALAGLLITRAEFAWLVFPSHRYARPPYELDPALFWFQLRSSSRKGLEHMLSRYGGQRLHFQGLSCGADTLQFGTGEPVRAWADCRVRFRASDATLTRRLFGTIVEHSNRFKLLSYATPD